MLNYYQRSRGKILVAAFIIAVVIAVVVMVALDIGASDDGILAVNRTLTIGEVTVKLESLKVDAGVLEVRHSASTDPRELYAYDDGVHIVRFANGEEIELLVNRADADGATQTSHFLLGRRKLLLSNVVDVNLGNYIVPRADIFGSTRIDLPRGFYEANQAGQEYIPLDSELFADYHHKVISDESLHYRITSIGIFENNYPVGSNFTITLEPTNLWSEQLPPRAIGDNSVILRDDEGRDYGHGGTSAHWDPTYVDGDRVRKVGYFRLRFDGLPSPTASYFNLQIEGAAESLGPFVFEDVQVPEVAVEPPIADHSDLNDAMKIEEEIGKSN